MSHGFSDEYLAFHKATLCKLASDVQAAREATCVAGLDWQLGQDGSAASASVSAGEPQSAAPPAIAPAHTLRLAATRAIRDQARNEIAGIDALLDCIFRLATAAAEYEAFRMEITPREGTAEEAGRYVMVKSVFMACYAGGSAAPAIDWGRVSSKAKTAADEDPRVRQFLDLGYARPVSLSHLFDRDFADEAKQSYSPSFKNAQRYFWHRLTCFGFRATCERLGDIDDGAPWYELHLDWAEPNKGDPLVCDPYVGPWAPFYESLSHGQTHKALVGRLLKPLEQNLCQDNEVDIVAFLGPLDPRLPSAAFLHEVATQARAERREKQTATVNELARQICDYARVAASMGATQVTLHPEWDNQAESNAAVSEAQAKAAFANCKGFGSELERDFGFNGSYRKIHIGHIFNRDFKGGIRGAEADEAGRQYATNVRVCRLQLFTALASAGYRLSPLQRFVGLDMTGRRSLVLSWGWEPEPGEDGYEVFPQARPAAGAAGG